MKINFKSFFIILIGSLLVAIGTYFFLAPSHIAAGGISGAAIIINSIFPSMPIGALMMAMELVLFTTGILVIGPVFGGKTVFCSFSISGMILLLERLFPNIRPLSNDMLIQLIFGVLICGVGMAIVFNQNASTGGTDIIAKIINKYFKISIGRSILIADVTVTIAASITFGIDKGLYAILGVIANSTLIDNVIKSLNTYKQVAIISNAGEQIKDYIVDTLERSATIYYAKGAYNNNEREVITTVISNKQFLNLKEYIKNIDGKAFITVNEVNEVVGEGFADFI
ncbi:YitT family protein [Clostridiaceae bacterium UIB06]|uniref:YitT family protein n=1 Tax=Clostridium thailandense TaxID=2794346 RepID=A0A949U0Z3_9CLOT|nr:YitT family protein [Clostridium thailandense]MBV7275431.1 YitT family protein [Clostridium thailandense]MCH5136708.1 YitT family protein [Clostridiaceae bacterium UIB06]